MELEALTGGDRVVCISGSYRRGLVWNLAWYILSLRLCLLILEDLI